MAKSIIANLTSFDRNDRVTYFIEGEYLTAQALADHVLCQKNNRRTVACMVEIRGKPMTFVEFDEPKARFVPSAGFHENHRILVYYTP